MNRRDLWLRCRALIFRKRSERELHEELDFHLEMQTRKNRLRHMDEAEATRHARLKFGNAVKIAEECRDERRLNFVETLIKDVRYSLRTLWRAPAFTLIAVLTLVLGIGANTAIFSVVNAVLLQPLPYPAPERLMVIWEQNKALGTPRDPVAPPNFLDWQNADTGFQQLAGFRYGSLALTGLDEPEQITGLAVSQNLFETLGIQPVLGRVFTRQEESGRERVVILTHRFWQRQFGGRPSIIGQTIRLSNQDYSVVGVTPAGFEFPPNDDSVEVFAPLTFIQGDMSRRSHSLRVIGRLNDGVTPDQARERLGSVARNIAASDPGSNPEVSVSVAQDALVENVRLSLLVLLATVGFVLLIACANVANLLLVRGTARAKEIAIRTSLGASRLRIARQLLTENLILAVIGGTGGVLLARWTLRLFIRLSPADLPRMHQVTIDSTVLLFAIAVSIATGMVFGLVPTAQLSRTGLSGAMKQGRGVGRQALIVVEVAVSLMVLTGAGLLIRSFVNIQTVDYGFRPENTLTMQVFLNSNRYPIDNSQFAPLPPAGAPRPSLSRPAEFFATALERIQALPGVQSAGATSGLPLNEVSIDFDLPALVEGRPRPPAGQELQADFRIATPDYFRTMGIRVMGGRVFSDFDGPDASSVAIINDVLAQALFAKANPIGSRLLLYGRPREIVGVVGSVRHRGFGTDPRPEMYLPSRQFMFTGMTIVVKTAVDPASMIETIKKEIHAIDPDQPVYRFRTLNDFVADAVAQSKFTTMLVASFALVALALALVGIYGVISYTVVQRTREIGIRMALGAEKSEVLRMIFRQGFGVLMIGIAAGVAGSSALTRFMKGLLFGVSQNDPLTYAAVAVVLMLVAFVAIYVPARRATRVDPLLALRHE